MARPDSSSGRRRDLRSARPTLNYYRSSAANTPPPPKTRSFGDKLKLIAKRLADGVVLLAVLALIVYSLIVSTSPKVSLSSNIYHDTATYQRAVASAMSAFGQHNKITFDKNAILKALQAQYPEVMSADINLPLVSHQASVYITVAPPVFRLATGQTDYVINSNGVVVADANDYPALSKLPLITDQSGFPAAPGKTIFDSASINFINQLLVQLKQAKINIGKMVLPPRAEELDLTAADHPYYVRFYLEGDSLTQIGRYLAARHYFQAHHIQPSQYLDARVSGKIFYK